MGGLGGVEEARARDRRRAKTPPSQGRERRCEVAFVARDNSKHRRLDPPPGRP